MVAQDIRKQLITKLDELSERELEALLHYIEVMQTMRLPDNYDEDHDPLVGFFSGPTDLAERSKEILWAEFGLPKAGNADHE
jgi:hypothetical protein